eukprot:jgi/Chrzof1/9715/Cz04g13060.t1
MEQQPTGEAIAVCFTGGKDSVLALHLAAGFRVTASSASASTSTQCGVINRLAGAQPFAVNAAACRRHNIALLVTFGPEVGTKASTDFKAHPTAVIQAQAECLYIPHLFCCVSPPYLESYRDQIAQLRQQYGITQLVTGDILDVCDGFMKQAVMGTGVQLVTPLWQQDRYSLLRSLWDMGIHAHISCVNLSKFDTSKVPDSEGKDGPINAQACCSGGLTGVEHRLVETNPHFQQPSALVAMQCLTAAVVSSCSYSAASTGTAGDQHDFDPARDLLGAVLDQKLCDSVLLWANTWLGVDLCGEHGEYHTMVVDAPLFKKRLNLNTEKEQEGSFAYLRTVCIEYEAKH